MKYLFVLLMLSVNCFASPEMELIKAIKNQDLVKVQSLLSQIEDLNYVKRITPLQAAITVKNVALIDQLIKLGADVNYSKKVSESALFTAVKTKDLSILKHLLKTKPEINITRMIDQDTPLMIAARLGQIEMFDLLIEHGASMDALDAFGDDLLSHAVYFNNLEMTKHILAKGANINGYGSSYQTSLDHSTTQQFDALSEYLRSKGGKHFSELDIN